MIKTAYAVEMKYSVFRERTEKVYQLSSLCYTVIKEQEECNETRANFIYQSSLCL
jgi:hypothetical protein